ncbi:MAG: type II secretion system F family protein [Chitinophagaceae bacterium]|nr:type II secretion system F family protein [Polaromonas sp.]
MFADHKLISTDVLVIFLVVAVVVSARKNQCFQPAVQTARLSLVREGAPLARALAHNQRFPALLDMFARQREQTGQLPGMLDRAALQLRNDV